MNSSSSEAPYNSNFVVVKLIIRHASSSGGSNPGQETEEAKVKVQVEAHRHPAASSSPDAIVELRCGCYLSMWYDMSILQLSCPLPHVKSLTRASAKATR
jgi:hypothetical protein